MTVATLPGDARAAMMAEAQRLWSRAGVTIEWLEAGAPTHDAALRVLVVSRHNAAPAETHRWPVAELLIDALPMPTAIASLDGAWRVVDGAAPPSGELALLRHQRLGRVLGRAVAHEIGHHLLGRGHAPHGLMRARIAAVDFADLRDGGFALDRHGAALAVAAVTRPPLRLAALPMPR